MEEQFTMSMFARKEDLYKAKAEYYENELRRAAGIMTDFVTFTRDCERRGVIDDACDPSMAEDAAEIFIKQYATEQENCDDHAGSA